MVRIRLVIILICISYGAAMPQDKASQAPSKSSFSLSPDNIRALENSVNLYNGQVSFPMELASLQGRGALNISASILYNAAGIDDVVDRPNLYSPTGILGLGWSLDIPQITCDFKETGTRHDDDFYLREQGATNPLICTHYYTSPRKFVTKNFNAWKVEFYPGEDKWIITRENGFQYTFQAAQYMVKWGNWVGQSATTEEQSRLSYNWALTEVQDLWGNKMQFQYTAVEEPVSSCSSCGGLAHTKARYLHKIIDPIGQSLEFFYGEKEAVEYQDPHTEQPEPDAYQEKYETRYLDNLVLRSAQNTVLYTVDLNYELQGEGSVRKRYLSTIEKQYPSGAQDPAVQFEYFDESDSKGYLKKVVNATGSHVNYYYTGYTVKAAKTLGVTYPSGYGQPASYVAGDYVVVTFRQLNGQTIDNGPRPVKVYVFHWDGEWHQEELWEVANINNGDYNVADIAMAEKHFIYKVYEYGANRHRIFAARKNENAVMGGDRWATAVLSLPKNGGNAAVEGRVFAGDDFAGFIERSASEFKAFTWRNDKWNIESVVISDPAREHYVTARNNFLFVHNDGGNSYDKLHMYYLDGEKKWQHNEIPASLSFDSDGENGLRTLWYSANSFVLGFPQYNPEYIYMWDEDYTSFARFNVIGQTQDDAQVYISSHGQIGINRTDARDGYALRYDGVNWLVKRFNYENYKESSYGEDYVVFSAKPSGILQAWMLNYNPNISEWNNQISLSLVLTNDGINPNERHGIHAGINMFQVDHNIFRRQPHSWEFYDKIPLASGELLMGQSNAYATPNFLTYSYNTAPQNRIEGYYILNFKDGEIVRSQRNPVPLASRLYIGAGTNILTQIESNGNGVVISWVDADHPKDEQTTLVADHISWSDGNRVFETFYRYDSARLTPEGMPQFNRATVIAGSGTDTPHGYTQHYFYNGSPASSMPVLPPSDYPDLGKFLRGLSYQTSSYNSDGVEISKLRTTHRIFSKEVTNSTGVALLQSYYARATYAEQTVDNVTTTTTENLYQPETGLIKTMIFRNRATPYSREATSTNFTYYWERYGDSRNILSPVVQAITAVERFEDFGGPHYVNTVVSKWGYNSAANKYFPIWQYKNRTAAVSDFSAWMDWSEASEEDWMLTEKVTKYDINGGAVYETQASDGVLSSVLYDATQTRSIAKASFAGYDQIAFTSFEDAAAGNWIYSGALVVDTDGVTGSRCFRSARTNVGDPEYQYIKKGLAKGTYELSYWSKAFATTVEVANGAVLETVSLETRDGWTLKRSMVEITAVSGEIRLKVPSGGLVDELRVKPQGAGMTSYVYNVEGNLVAETNSSLVQQYYQYDEQYRLVAVRDYRGNIVKHYTYHVRDEQ